MFVQFREAFRSDEPISSIDLLNVEEARPLALDASPATVLIELIAFRKAVTRETK